MRGDKVRLVLLAAALTWPVGCRRLRVGARASHVPLTTASGEQTLGPEITRLEVESLAGAITVVAGREDKITVEAAIKISAARLGGVAEPGEFAEHVRVTTHGETLTVADAHMGRPDARDWHVSFVIQAPARLALAASLEAGNVRVEGVGGDLGLSTGAGNIEVVAPAAGGVVASTAAGVIDIRVDRITGSLTATNTAGNVEVRVADDPPTEDVTLTSQVGSVLLELPADSPGAFELSATVGSVSVSGHDGLSITRAGLSQRATGTIGQGGPDYLLTAATGSIALR